MGKLMRPRIQLFPGNSVRSTSHASRIPSTSAIVVEPTPLGAGRSEANGTNVLVALMSETDSQAVSFL